MAKVARRSRAVKVEELEMRRFFRDEFYGISPGNPDEGVKPLPLQLLISVKEILNNWSRLYGVSLGKAIEQAGRAYMNLHPELSARKKKFNNFSSRIKRDITPYVSASFRREFRVYCKARKLRLNHVIEQAIIEEWERIKPQI